MAEGSGDYKSRKASRKKPDRINLGSATEPGQQDAIEAAMGKASAGSKTNLPLEIKRRVEALRKKVEDPERALTQADIDELRTIKKNIEGVVGGDFIKQMAESDPDGAVDVVERLMDSSESIDGLVEKGSQRLTTEQVTSVIPESPKSVATSGGKSASSTKASMHVPTGPPADGGDEGFAVGNGDDEELVKLKKVVKPVQPGQGEYLAIIDTDGNLVDRKFPEDLLGHETTKVDTTKGYQSGGEYRDTGVGARDDVRGKVTDPKRMLPAVSAGGGTVPSDVIDDPVTGRQYKRKTNTDTGDFVDSGRASAPHSQVGGKFSKDYIGPNGPITDPRRMLPAAVGPVGAVGGTPVAAAEEATGLMGKLKKGAGLAKASKVGRFAGKALPVVGEALAAYEIAKFAYNNTAGLYDEQRAEQAALGFNVIASLENSKVEGQEFILGRMLDRADDQSRALRDTSFLQDAEAGVMLDQIIAGKERVLSQTSYREQPTAGELLAAMSRF